MLITVNAEERQVSEATSVADLITELPHHGIAVAVDGTVIPRADHANFVLSEGAAVEIVTAVQGG